MPTIVEFGGGANKSNSLNLLAIKPDLFVESARGMSYTYNDANNPFTATEMYFYNTQGWGCTGSAVWNVPGLIGNNKPYKVHFTVSYVDGGTNSDLDFFGYNFEKRYDNWNATNLGRLCAVSLGEFEFDVPAGSNFGWSAYTSRHTINELYVTY